MINKQTKMPLTERLRIFLETNPSDNVIYVQCVMNCMNEFTVDDLGSLIEWNNEHKKLNKYTHAKMCEIYEMRR